MDKSGYFKELKIKRIEISTGELIAIINEIDAKELSVVPLERIIVKNPKTEEYTAVVVDITKGFVKKGEIGLYADVFDSLDLNKINKVDVMRAPKPESVTYIKEKLHGDKLDLPKITAIVNDIKYNILSKIELTAFMTSVFIHGMDLDESYFMAKNIADSGEHLGLNVDATIVDKHSIGGINGRATMLVVPIIASTGLYIPKTASRAITSPAGTADAMEVLAGVEFSIERFKEIVLKTHGAIIWGGGIDLAPVDDKMIQVEFPLSLDPKGQVVASVLAKKYSVGAQKVIIDLPVGKDLKVKTLADAEDLAKSFVTVGKRLGMDVKALITNGEYPSGPAFGPALEARHAMRILEGKVYDNLAEKSTELAGKILELTNKSKQNSGADYARRILKEGKAHKKMLEIIDTQGKKINKSKDIEIGEYSEEILSKQEGYIRGMSIKGLVELARQAGCPFNKGAGVLLNVEPHENIIKGDVLYTIYAENKEKLSFAKKYAEKNSLIILENEILEEIV